MWKIFVDFFWPLLLTGASVSFASIATVHAVVQKRETRTVIGWVGLIWLTPLLGSFLYYCFGINRIARKAHDIQDKIQKRVGVIAEPLPGTEQLFQKQQYRRYRQLAIALQAVSRRELQPGNEIVPLLNGEMAFPAMLSAIENAKKTIALCTYIFDYDRAGKKFVDALEAAHLRGVQVFILVDDVGSRYSRPQVVRELRRRGVRAATFLPTLVPRLPNYANLRNHRKILVIDSSIGFTGGMNIREGNRLEWKPAHPIQDLHFQIKGPVLAHLLDAFLADWSFATAEPVESGVWEVDETPVGEVWARGITDGPDADLDHIRLAIIAALAEAEKRVDIVTPYFLPDDALITAINVASMRGVDVRIVLPEKNNIRLVGWATVPLLTELIQRGVKIYQTPPPFDHTKLLLVDDVWSMIGSCNWDPRSFRLNFEFNVECYGTNLCAQLRTLVDEKVAISKQVTIEEIEQRPFYAKVRDGLARLASPYL